MSANIGASLGAYSKISLDLSMFYVNLCFSTVGSELLFSIVGSELYFSIVGSNFYVWTEFSLSFKFISLTV